MNARDHGARRSTDTDDRGFTLVEFVTIITVVGLVLGALSAATIVFLRNSDDIRDKLDASHGAQLTTRYLPSDLQSVAPGGASAPGVSVECGVTANVLQLTWTDLSTSPSVRYDAMYYLDASGSELRRALCVAGTLESDVQLARNVDSAVATVTGSQVDLSISIAGTPADPGGFQYSVFGQRRT